jgi:rhamnulokinase
VGEVPVIAAASHDTAAAVAATPGEGRDWAYISSGTWSLMGVENEEPIISRASLDGNFTNEGGVGGTFRVLKNISGLWLLQQCRKAWAGEREYGYDELTGLARSSAPFQTVIEPDHPSFLSPSDMTEAIRRFCRRTRQRPPGTPAEFTRCILEGLALKYRMVLDQLGEMYEHPISRIHIIGGGCRNELLCQFTAEATGLPVLAGPVEATAAGNVLVQALALGHIGSLAEMRHIVSNSFPTKVYEPCERQGWDSAYERFREVHARVIEPQEGS